VSVQQLEEGAGVQERLDLEGAGGGTNDPDAATPDAGSRRRALEDALGSVRERFGADSVGAAAFVDRGRLRTGRRASLWGPDEPDPESEEHH
jgi:hypothetical protein